MAQREYKLQCPSIHCHQVHFVTKFVAGEKFGIMKMNESGWQVNCTALERSQNRSRGLGAQKSGKQMKWKHQPALKDNGLLTVRFNMAETALGSWYFGWWPECIWVRKSPADCRFALRRCIIRIIAITRKAPAYVAYTQCYPCNGFQAFLSAFSQFASFVLHIFNYNY